MGQWPSSSAAPSAGPWQCHLLASSYMGAVSGGWLCAGCPAQSRCSVRLRALVESALTLLCWECRGPGVLQDKWGGGTRVPRGRSDLGTVSVAFEQKAWMKRPFLSESVQPPALARDVWPPCFSPLNGSPVL